MKRLITTFCLLLASFGAYANQCILSGVTDQGTFFVAVDATDFTTRETGLSSFTVYRARDVNASAAMTTPTVVEIDATNQPGVYRLLLDEDTTIAAGNDVEHMVFTITHAGMAPVTKEICLARAKITAGNTLTVASDGDLSEVNTVTGHTAQTGDSYARLGAPAGASHAADIAAVKSDTAATLTDTADMQPKLGTMPNLGGGATLGQAIRDLAGATFVTGDDSNEALRNRGDAAWTTGGAGADPSIQSTTVASVTSQTLLVPTATPTFVDQINGWAVYLEDAGDADAYHLTKVTDYNQSTGVVTIETAAPFTVASSDTMVFLPAFLAEGVDVTSWNGTALSTTNPLPNAAPAANGGLPTVNASNQVAGVSGNVVGSVGSVTGAVGSVTGNVGGNVVGSVASVTGAVGSVTGNVGGNVTGSVGSVTGAVGSVTGNVGGTVNGLTSTAQGNVRTAVGLASANLDTQLDALPTAAENATEHLSQQRVLTGTCDSGSTTTCVDDALTQANESQLDDRLICFSDSWCALITGFTPASDTVTTTKAAPSTRASLGYTIFPATAQ